MGPLSNSTSTTDVPVEYNTGKPSKGPHLTLRLRTPTSEEVNEFAPPANELLRNVSTKAPIQSTQAPLSFTPFSPEEIAKMLKMKPRLASNRETCPSTQWRQSPRLSLLNDPLKDALLYNVLNQQTR